MRLTLRLVFVLGVVATLMSRPARGGVRIYGQAQQVSVTPTPIPAQALNMSTRARVETGDNVVIGGFIITGGSAGARNGLSGQLKKVAIRGLGPSLVESGLTDVLS